MLARKFAKTLISLLIVALVLISGKLSAAEEIKMWVASSVRAGIFDKIKDPFEKVTGIKVVYVGDTTTTGSDEYFIDVINNKVEAAATSLAYDEWVRNLQKRNIEIPNDITYRVIGHDVMKVLAHPSAGIKELTLAHLEAIGTGKATNWKQVGGADMPIKLIIAPNKTATNSSFQKVVMKGAAFGGKIISEKDGNKINSFEEVLQTTMNTPGAFGFIPGTIDSEKAALIKTPPIGRPITLINRGKPSAKLLKLVDYIRAEYKN